MTSNEPVTRAHKTLISTTAASLMARPPVATRGSWLEAGKPFRLAQPIADLVVVLRRYGYTVGTIGNEAHLRARTPEDHCPFSVTGWPGSSPYPYVMACDIMAPRADSGLPALGDLGAQIAADRNAGHDGVAWLKYMNWTPPGGRCRHESWKPNHAVKASSDTGHIHLSCRTDFATSAVGAGYDPVARLQRRPVSVAPTGRPAPPFVKEMRQGARGAHVRRWQQRMRDRGWPIAVDGEYGPASVAVCRQFQREKGLAVDGITGPRTWSAAWTAPRT